MLGSHEAQGPAMCAVDGCPQPAEATAWRVHTGASRYIWVRLCRFCAVEIKTAWFMERKAHVDVA